jgi:hypothetical protein
MAFVVLHSKTTAQTAAEGGPANEIFGPILAKLDQQHEAYLR